MDYVNFKVHSWRLVNLYVHSLSLFLSLMHAHSCVGAVPPVTYVDIYQTTFPSHMYLKAYLSQALKKWTGPAVLTFNVSSVYCAWITLRKTHHLDIQIPHFCPPKYAPETRWFIMTPLVHMHIMEMPHPHYSSFTWPLA